MISSPQDREAVAQGMRWVVHCSSFGDYLYVAVFAPSPASAVTVAEQILFNGTYLSSHIKARLGGWRRETWPVDHVSVLTLWERARAQPGRFIYRDGA